MTDASLRPKTAYDVILEWSADRPGWQRDCLRRIVQAQTLTEGDIAELATLCKIGRSAPDSESGPAPHPLDASHFPSNPSAAASVSLVSIKDVSAVNRLAPDQILDFGTDGITVIYGDNGAGKSGYGRLLKRACRARHSEVILSDVYSPSPSASPSATLNYSVGGVVQPPETWEDTGKPEPQPHPILSAISVFDADCADVHVRNKNQVAFRPFGLDVPDELSKACKLVKSLLDAEKAQHETLRNAMFKAPPWSATTAVGRALAALTHATDLTVIEALASVTDQEKARLTRLTEDLSKNPATAASEQSLKADRVRHLIGFLRGIESATAGAVFDELFALHADAVGKREAARLAAHGLFGTAALPDVGGEAWRNLWEAARRYSTEAAYPEGRFPPDRADLLCVLCHEPLSDDAAERMGRFEEFVRDDTERLAGEAEAAFEVARQALFTLTIGIGQISDSLREIELQDPALARAVRRGMASARLRKQVALRRLAGRDAVEMPGLVPIPVSGLGTLEKEIRAYAIELQGAADDGVRKALEAERLGLADRLTLLAHIEAVMVESARLKSIKLLESCSADTTTNAVTTLGNSIADQVLTPHLRDRFAEEIIGLVGVNVRVELVRSGGLQGSPLYQVRLLAKPDAKVASILSEGEQTCVAIAAFLAELATAPHKSALVFDDPITSLDHKWRQRVAERLVKESAVRQVIVFTHDLVFLNDIRDAAAHLPFAARHIRRSSTTVGMVNDALPWTGMKIAERIDSLGKRARALGGVRANEDEDTYKLAAGVFYSDLRAAWERGLEEVAFAGVLLRHRDYINAKELARVTAFSAPDSETWADNYKKCSNLMSGHDESRGRNRAMPEPEELLQDVASLDTWVRGLRERQKDL